MASRTGSQAENPSILEPVSTNEMEPETSHSPDHENIKVPSPKGSKSTDEIRPKSESRSNNNEQKSQDDYSLHFLCKEGSLGDIQQFFQNNGNAKVDVPDEYGYAPIHHVIRRDTNDVEKVLTTLYTYNADVNSRTLQEGDTSLHITAKRFREEEAILISLSLLSQGADPDYRNDKYRKPYDIAVARNMMTLANFFSAELTKQAARIELEIYRKTNYGPRLVNAVIEGNKEMIDNCLKAGADPNYINKHGAASIHYTVTHCSLDKMVILRQLLDAGADVNLQDYEGDTALNLVIKSESIKASNMMKSFVEELVNSGSDKTLQDLDGKDASRLAREKNYADIVYILDGENNFQPPDNKAKPYNDWSSQASLHSNKSNKPNSASNRSNNALIPPLSLSRGASRQSADTAMPSRANSQQSNNLLTVSDNNNIAPSRANSRRSNYNNNRLSAGNNSRANSRRSAKETNQNPETRTMEDI